MKTFISLFLLISFSSFASDNGVLERSCLKDGGRIVDRIVCPQSGKVREEKFCVLEGGMFYNGCTASVAGYGEVFFEACKLHDHCYHHEPITSGAKKEVCDQIFYHNMMEICRNKFDFVSCETMASSFYNAVKYFGSKSCCSS